MIVPPATLGLLGGGQLGRYFVMAAREMGYRVTVLDPDPHSPAAGIADQHILAGYNDPVALDRIAKGCAAVTTEFENVPAESLAHIARFTKVWPDVRAVSICQNRSLEKAFLAQHKLQHTPYVDIRNEAEIAGINPGLFPGILKIARFGYDGKGQAGVEDRAAVLAAFRRFDGEACILEQRLPLEYELSVVLARNESGQIECFPVSENHHRNGILDTAIAPAGISSPVIEKARQMAKEIALQLGYIGTLTVEFFVVGGRLYVNEMAPRPHNSGHYTLDACVSSQYEQQVRALCGLPLGDVSVQSCSVMVNLLGDLWYSGDPQHACEPDWSKLLSIPNLKLHFYGKLHARRGRKMGHFTVIGDDPEKVRETAMLARAAIGIRDDE